MITLACVITIKGLSSCTSVKRARVSHETNYGRFRVIREYQSSQGCMKIIRLCFDQIHILGYNIKSVLIDIHL